MYKMLIGVLVWKILVKTLGFGLWPEPLMAMSIIEVNLPAPFATLETPDPWIR
jgi:hypothetical protein